MTIDRRCNSIKKVRDLSVKPKFYKAQILIDYNNWVNNIQQLQLVNSQSDREVNKYLLTCYHNLLNIKGYKPFEILCQNFIGVPNKLPVAIRNNLSNLLHQSYPLMQVRIAEGVKHKGDKQQANVDPMINAEIARILRRANQGYPVEEVFLFSGDSDFLPMAQTVIGAGIPFTFIGSPPCLSNKIQETIDQNSSSLNLITLEQLLYQ